MSATATETAPRTGDEIVIVPDVDSIASTEVMLGCGNDNPYQ